MTFINPEIRKAKHFAFGAGRIFEAPLRGDPFVTKSQPLNDFCPQGNHRAKRTPSNSNPHTSPQVAVSDIIRSWPHQKLPSRQYPGPLQPQRMDEAGKQGPRFLPHPRKCHAKEDLAATAPTWQSKAWDLVSKRRNVGKSTNY